MIVIASPPRPARKPKAPVDVDATMAGVLDTLRAEVACWMAWSGVSVTALGEAIGKESTLRRIVNDRVGVARTDVIDLTRAYMRAHPPQGWRGAWVWTADMGGGDQSRDVHGSRLVWYGHAPPATAIAGPQA